MNADFPTMFLRLSLSAGFFSAVASRLGFWGKLSSGWKSFVQYTAEVNAFVPVSWAPALAVTSTILETTIGIMLLIGYKTNYAAIASFVLTLIFALAMSFSYGIKEPLDYSVFAVSAGSLLLASFSEFRWSIDQLLSAKI